MTEPFPESESFQRAEGPSFLTETAFETFQLPEPVLAGLRDARFFFCTPIQAQALPIALEGKDVAGQAQTGTGKTAAFLVPSFTRLLGLPDRTPGVPAALILSPTRELAHQIFEDASVLGRHTGLSQVEVVGGVDYQRQAEILKQGVDLVIATPGRLIDYYKQRIFRTDGIRIVVIDEADRLLDLGFADDMRFILRKLPSYQKRQSLLFSATLSHRVLELTYEYMNLPEFISTIPENLTVEGIEQSLYHVARDRKLSLLLGLLKNEAWSRVLIFVNTKSGVDWLSQKLKRNALPADGITGDLPQRKRFSMMAQFKEGRIQILVATDVASRGIHVEDISHIINYDIPQDPDSYVHRIGRTARAGKTGKAITLACEEYVFHLEPLEQKLGYKIPVVWPPEEWFQTDAAGGGGEPRRGRANAPGRGRKTGKGRPFPREGRASKSESNGSPPEAATRTPSSRSFPGAFFGFGPPAQSPEPAPGTESPPEPAPKKRHRRSKKRRSSTRKGPPAPTASES